MPGIQRAARACRPGGLVRSRAPMSPSAPQFGARAEASPWPTALAFFTVALVVHLVRLSLWTPYPDELGYAETARELLQRGAWTSDRVMFFPPLYVYLAAVAQALGAELLASVRIVSAVCGAGVVALAVGIAFEQYGRRVAVGCGAVFVVLMRLNEYSRIGQPETIHILLGMAAFLWALRWMRDPRPRHLAWCGAFLGLAVWGKEVSLSYVLGLGTFLGAAWVLGWRRPAPRDLLALAAGGALLVVPLVVFGELSGNSLLFEVSGEKSYDVNMLDLPLVQSLETTARNTLVMLAMPKSLAFVVGAPAVLALAALLVAGVRGRRPLPLLALCYGVVMAAFVTWFRQKFIYYILPAVLLALLAGWAEVLRALLVRDAVRRRLPYAAAGLVLVALLGCNLWLDRDLYLTRGGHDMFRVALHRPDLGRSIAASHTNLFQYVNEREGLGLEIRPLFVGPDYLLNQEALDDPRTTSVLTKDYYLDTLGGREDWRALRAAFPRESRQDGLVVLQR